MNSCSPASKANTMAVPPASLPHDRERLTASPLVLLVTFGTGGDLEPFILMAQSLQARGHRVCVVASREHETRLNDGRVPYRLFGDVAEVDAVLDNPDLWHERKGLGIIAQGLNTGLGELVQLLTYLVSKEPCVALCHPFTLAAADIVRSQYPDLRRVGVWLAPSNLRTIHDPLMLGSIRVPRWFPFAWRRKLWNVIDRHWVDNVMLPALNALRSARKLALVDHYFKHLADSCEASVGLFPSWFAPPVADWPSPFVDAGFPFAAKDAQPTLSPGVEQFLASGTQPIIFTFGTGMRHASAMFEHAAHALQAMGRRGMFVSRYTTQMPEPLPPNILWVQDVPFDVLLPRASAIVHHGGIGTSAAAIRAGIPQLAVAYGFDQFDNGERLRLLGVGDMLPATRAGKRSLKRRLERVLTSSTIRAKCREMALLIKFTDNAGTFIENIECAIALSGAINGQGAPLSNLT